MLLSLPSSYSLFLLSLHFFLLHSPLLAYGSFYYGCGSFDCDTCNYTANSDYESNLNLLLRSLATDDNFFFPDSIGQGLDEVYGETFCRGDINVSLCRSCLKTAAHDIVRLCPYKIEAVVWYDACLLRYSNVWPPSTTQIESWNNKFVTHRLLFEKLLTELLSALIDSVAYNATAMFATGEVNFTTDFHTIYGLVQCPADENTCRPCLQKMINGKPDYLQGIKGGKVSNMDCSYRYEVYKFYHGSSMLKLGSLTPAATEPTPGIKKKHGSGLVPKIAIPIVSSALLISIIYICFRIRRKSAKNLIVDEANVEEITRVESLLLDLSMLRVATANFSVENKLGKGGFGTVYKGTLPNGQELAVKKLSTTSKQGLAELKNELVSVAKLRHKNLIRLLGVCLEKEEKLLVYEYVPNRSLDTILFDPIKRGQLDWEKRYRIISGIAKGLLYLHEESQLKIMHRDLKAGNILLDADMNPKISDFGLARLFGRDQNQIITNRIVGTYGYMAPEYAMHGRFSLKSDVYSYGVLVLEIITGRKNNGIFYSATDKYLLTYIWEQWNNGTVLEMVDPCLRNHCPKTKVLKCIQIGLLCVQENPSDRPNMSTVVMMLNNDLVSIQAPSRPAFCIGQLDLHGGMHNQSLDGLIRISINEVSITQLEAR